MLELRFNILNIVVGRTEQFFHSNSSADELAPVDLKETTRKF